ncbi:MAG: TIR domain-containing protein [Chloroflexota bacterium]
MSDIFISYSRRDKDFVRQLHSRLTDDDYDVWVDWEDIPATADWWQEIKSSIEEAHLFVFVISPHSVVSDVCRQEINHAIENNKRFIPVLYQLLEDVNSPDVHEAIRSHNWIDFSAGEVSDEPVELLIESFTTEPDYLRRHTRLLVRAREWQQSGRQPSYLIEGAELNEFQEWLQESQTRTPKPTELQYDYILASQTQRTRVQLRVAGGLMLAIIVVGILSILAIIQQQRLEDQAEEQQAIEATSDAISTQFIAQQTRVVEAQQNQQDLLNQVYSQETQQAISLEVTGLRGTISAFETRSVITNTPLPTATPTVTATNTLPPTWTPTAIVIATDTTDTDSETSNEVTVQTADMVTIDPNIADTATVQAILYATATQEAMVTPTATLTDTPIPTPTLTNTPLPTATPTLDAPAPIDLGSQTVTYVVESGDLGIDIANRFNVTVNEIAEASGLSNLSRIFVGQELQIPYQTNITTDESLLVAPTGVDSPTCGTETNPCRTISGAIEVANGFAQIRLASGIYEEELLIERDVVLVGNGIDNTILTGDFSGRVVTVNPDVNLTMVNLTITGGSAEYGGGILNLGEVNLQNVRSH